MAGDQTKLSNISFAIPTWNRAITLERCVDSIASQNPYKIFISDNASTDETPELCAFLAKKYPFVSYKRLEEHGTYDVNFKSVVDMADGDYIWMFGDDDVLEPNGLAVMSQIMDDVGAEFYHCAEVSRAKSNTIYTAKLIDLCNQYGFIDMTGFITGNIAKADKLKEGFASKNLKEYSKSAFVQSLCILEKFSDSDSALIDLPIVRSAQECQDGLKRWNDERISEKYAYVSLGLKELQKDGIIPEKLPETFYRYIDGCLINRLMSNYIARVVNPVVPMTELEWNCLRDIVSSVDGERGEELVKWFDSVKSLADIATPYIQKAVEAAETMSNAANSIKLPKYEYQYT